MLVYADMNGVKLINCSWIVASLNTLYVADDNRYGLVLSVINKTKVSLIFVYKF